MPGRQDARTDGTARTADGLATFVERFALDLTVAGFARMPARVFVALLVTEEGAATAAELAAFLQISPAAVSGAVRYLEQVELVARERVPGHRHDRYRLHAPDVWYEAVERKDRMYERFAGTLAGGIAAAGPDTAVAARLDDSRRFFEFVRAEMPALYDRWRRERGSG